MRVQLRSLRHQSWAGPRRSSGPTALLTGVFYHLFISFLSSGWRGSATPKITQQKPRHHPPIIIFLATGLFWLLPAISPLPSHPHSPSDEAALETSVYSWANVAEQVSATWGPSSHPLCKDIDQRSHMEPTTLTYEAKGGSP